MSLLKNCLDNAEKVRFHTPGHSGTLPEEWMRADVTELSYSDNLLCPTGEIASLEKKIASVYHAEACFISTQGATTSIFEGVFATKERGAYLLIGALHKSVYNAMRAFGCKAYHIDRLTKESPIPSDVRIAVFTSPDYFGHCLPVAKMCSILREKNILSMVDASHGSHFIFNKEFPVSATEYADLVIHSVHKTLPVATGGSLLLVQNKNLITPCKLARNILHGSSPSYITLCSIEQAFAKTESYSALYDEAIAEVISFRKKLVPPFVCEKTDDPTRLVVSSPYEGEEVANELEKKGFVAEMSYENKVVFIVTPYNARYLSALAVAFDELSATKLTVFISQTFPCCKHTQATEIPFGGEWEEIPLAQSVGRRVYLEVGFYPPGIPLLYSHDVVTASAVLLLQNNIDRTFGLHQGKIIVIKESAVPEKD